ncbi:MAG: hypothetical protein IJT51_04185 [Bacteroidales bacterium]|nr:hypothetical protein [Bacteroidales bacterium]
MKIRFISVALLAVLSLAAAGCQKEQSQYPVIPTHETSPLRQVSYTIDGVQFDTVIRGEEEWNQFLKSLIALAKQEHSVSFRDKTFSSVNSSKEVVTYTTTNENDAIEWSDKKTREGYEVWIEYDPKTGKFTCTAVK